MIADESYCGGEASEAGDGFDAWQEVVRDWVPGSVVRGQRRGGGDIRYVGGQGRFELGACVGTSLVCSQ